MISRRHLLGLAAGTALARALPAFAEETAVVAPPPPAPPACPGQGLRAAGCAKGIGFGTAIDSGALNLDQRYVDLVRRECSLLVPEWEMKWSQLQKERGKFWFGGVDRLVAFARDNGMGVRGHVLVWHDSAPDWLQTSVRATNYERLLEDHIERVVRHFGTDIKSWDVVNEALEPEDGRPDGMRNSFWLRGAGPDYVAAAFKIAAKHAPHAQLVYNDYGLEHDDAWCKRRRAATLKLLEKLKADGAPIHALGMQSHLRVGDTFTPEALADFLREVEAMGIKPLVTELDVRADRLSVPRKQDEAAADLARRFLDTVFANSSCDTVLAWGLSDGHSWITRANPKDRPTPFDHDLKAKPFYQAIRDAIDAAAPRTA